MRLFVAIELTDDARAAIAADQTRLKRSGDWSRSLKWVQPDRIHLTLAFLGEVDEALAARVVDVMQQAIHVSPFEIVFGGYGIFPPHGAPRVLWLGLMRGQQTTVYVQKIITTRLESI